MRLVSLTMHNFRKFKDVEINFPEGIIGLVGNNGAGKSTIIEAIGWAIYGNRAARTSKDQIKRLGASRSDDCWVKLVFEMGGNVYEVFRIISGNSTDARVKVNGLITASSTQGATQFLEKKLGMDYDSFYTSIVAKQQELNALSDKSPSERKRSMLRMLKIDVLEEAIKRVREDRRNKEKILEHLEKTLKDIDEMEKSKRENEEMLDELFRKKNELKEEIANLETKLKETEEKRRIEKEKAEKFKNLQERKKLLEERKRNKENLLEKKLEEKREIEEKVAEYEEIKKYADEYENVNKRKEEMEKLKQLYYERNNLQKEIESLEKEIEEINGFILVLQKELEGEKEIELEFKRIEREIKRMDEDIKNMEKDLEEKRAEKKFVLEKKADIENKLNKIKELGPESNCPTCGRLLGEKYEEIVKEFEEKIKKFSEEAIKLEREMGSMKTGIDELKLKREEIEKRRKEIENKLMNYRLVKERINSFQERKREKENKREEYIKRIVEIGEVEFSEEEYKKIVQKLKELMPLKNKVMILENEIKRLPLLEKDLKEIRDEINFVNKEVQQCMAELNALDFDVRIYEEVEKEYEKIRNIFHIKREEFIRIEGKIDYVKKEIERLEKEIEEQKKQREEIKNLKKEIANLEMLAGDRDTGLLNNFKNYLISKIGPLLSYYASHFFAIFTDGKYKEIEIDENYNIWIYDRGEKFELERFSGGEKDLANLSLRLAISQLITQKADVSLNFIALDEIFGSQDRERRKNVLNALAELKNQFKQILLITHIEEIKDSMEHIIKIYEDDEGISHATFE